MSSEGSLQRVISESQAWFERVVLGLNLCPFAHQPAKNNTVRFVSFVESQAQSLFECLAEEITRLQSTDVSILETTLIIAPKGFEDFYFFNDTLALLDNWLEKNGWAGFVQVASFHPDYQFAGSQPDDAENLTNRSPHPIFHLLRESSLSEVIDNGADTDSVPERNMAVMAGLSPKDKKRLFPYLFFE